MTGSNIMRRIEISAFGGVENLNLSEHPIPVPGDRDLLIRVAAAALNRADILQRKGLYPPPPGIDPMAPGLEYAGTVEEIGQDVTRFACGARVMGLTPGQAQADYVVVPELEAIPIPRDLSFTDAAALPEALSTAYDAIFLQGGLKRGQWCLIRAATSGVGIYACQLVAAMGCYGIGTSRSKERADKLVEFGAHGFLVEGQDDPRQAVHELSCKQGIKVILDLVGGENLNQILGVLAPQGTLIAVGFLGGAKSTVHMAKVVAKRLRIQGSILRTRGSDEKAALAIAFTDIINPLIAAGKIRPVIDSVMPCTAVRAAHQRMESNEHFGKIVLSFAE